MFQVLMTIIMKINLKSTSKSPLIKYIKTIDELLMEILLNFLSEEQFHKGDARELANRKLSNDIY